ncbi:MAG TPA: lytic transglycosylase domain-containing protein [Steroidobacteraceae bacterium]|nr:lytic transglycosylase domain-containing protein [Steroidobacteraceae bacterium]
MKPVIDPARARRRLAWIFSVLIGASMFLRTSELQTELILSSHPQPDRSIGPTCRIPATEMAPGIKALSRDIARRFHLAESAAAGITRAAFTAAQARGIDPTLVLAIAAVESKFKPRAVNPTTGATGLMQIMPRWHQDKIGSIGGESSLMLIAPNLSVGAAIMAEYLDAEDGDIQDALGHYLGTTGAERYLRRVNVEMAHLTRVMKAAKQPV